MSNWKKALLAFKVFLPIIIKSIINLWEEIMDAYEEQNVKQLKALNEQVNEYQKMV